MRVAVAIAFADRQEVIELEVREGATAQEAIAAARLDARLAGIDMAAFKVGIWSRPASLAAALREGDRVELYRDLKADPKDMRRRRARLKPSTRSRNEP